MPKKPTAGTLPKLRAKLISAALRDHDFQVLLSEALDEIRSAAKTAPNEATIESVFERVLYSLLKQIGLAFAPEKESSIATKRHVGKGRADSRIGALIIEFKHRSALRTKSGQQQAVAQLSEYAVSISKEIGTQVRGVITDGDKYFELSAENGEIKSQTGYVTLSKATLFRFVHQVHALQLTALTPKNLVQDFARADFEGAIFDSARVLEQEMTGGEESDKTRMLRLEWEAMFKLAHDDTSQQLRIQERRQILAEIFRKTIGSAKAEYRALFCLHTAYAITLKLMAFRVVCDLRFGSSQYNFKDFQDAKGTALRSLCSRLEDGEVFRELGILNLLEGDFFSWYADKKQWSSQIAECVRQLMQILARYEDVESVFATTDALDLFRELYEACVPQVVRASFGEFHTPYWLAQKVMDAAKPTGKWTALDPCCGSGTFIIAAIARIRKELHGKPPSTILENIRVRVAGFDLNPLSVLTTRISYFIHISDLLPDTLEDLVIPVYLGDASYVPEIRMIKGVRCLTYKLRTLQGDLDISLPESMARTTHTFIKRMRDVESHIGSFDANAAADTLIDLLKIGERNDDVIGAIKSMCQQLAELERKGWNGIWARILSNFLATACLPKFSCIVGNPPWIDWKNLPEKYREKIKSLCIDRGLFSGAGRTGGINLNICALITNVTSVNWAEDDGFIAFLMPRELANQASYEGWRTTGPGPGKTILELHDWSNAGHPFDPVKEDFMTFVMGPDALSKPEIPVIQYQRKKEVRTSAKQWKTVSEAESNLTVRNAWASPLIPGSTALTIASTKAELQEMRLVAGKSAYIGREGIEFYPQELLLFRYVGPGPKKGLVIVENIQVSKSKYPIPPRKRPLEEEFLFPLVKGPNIESFRLNDTTLLVPFPYDKTDPYRPIDEKSLGSRARFLCAYYKEHAEVINAQTKFSDKIRGANPGAFYGLARTGPYSFQDTYVAFRDNTKWRACVVGPTKTPWGTTRRMLFQNHAVSMCERTTGGYITETEAHYICAVLNAPSVEHFINHSSDNRSFKIRPPVHLPLFEAGDPLHRELARLSRTAHTDPANRESIRTKIDKVYLTLCRRR